MVIFGIAPYFCKSLQNEFKTSPCHVISCESFDYVLHSGQMDFVTWFWNESKKVVDTWYLISEFFQGANPEKLVSLMML